jgi:hypothetical protein
MSLFHQIVAVNCLLQERPPLLHPFPASFEGVGPSIIYFMAGLLPLPAKLARDDNSAAVRWPFTTIAIEPRRSGEVWQSE